MERLKHIKETLLSAVESQIANLANVDAKELGEVVDMVKDMEETMYYCAVNKAMKEKEEKEKYEKYAAKHYPPIERYVPMPMYFQQDGRYFQENYRDMDRYQGRMYYPGGNGGSGGGGGNSSGGNGGQSSGSGSGSSSGGGGRSNYSDRERYPIEFRDVREGRSPMSRKNYMESKELHQGAPAQMRELEKYMQELSQDITEMIEDASPEEKAVLQQKLSMLVSKIK